MTIIFLSIYIIILSVCLSFSGKIAWTPMDAMLQNLALGCEKKSQIKNIVGALEKIASPQPFPDAT